jgi:hypothetical protein
LGVFVTLEVDAAADDLVGWDGGSGEMLQGSGLVDGFLLGLPLLCGCVEFVYVEWLG